MKWSKTEPVNLLDLRPRRAIEWEESEEGLIVLLVPKFRNPLLVRWFVPLLASKNFRVKLDEFGSFVWRQCDGSTSVGRIGTNLAGKFGPAVEPVFDRIGKFLGKLERDGFVKVKGTSEEGA